MADTKALEDLNKKIVALVGELNDLQAKQDQLRDLMRQRSELEQRLLGLAADTGQRGPGRRRSNGQEPAPELAVVSKD